MFNKIDWISFSFVRPIGGHQAANEEAFLMYNAFDDLLGEFSEWFQDATEFEARGGRAPYEACFHHSPSGINIFWHTNLEHALVEISGRGCDWLQEKGILLALLNQVQHRVTRIDFARDIQTQLDPIVFAGQRDTQRFRSHSEFVSESGITAYVGSRTSNRYARVYRYHAPHERSHLMRVEMVCKAEDAKASAAYALKHGVEETIASLGSKFGWAHPAWTTAPLISEELKAYRPERREGKTLFWLADTIAPLLLRLEDDGVIDIDLWIADHLTPKRKKR